MLMHGILCAFFSCLKIDRGDIIEVSAVDETRRRTGKEDDGDRERRRGFESC